MHEIAALLDAGGCDYVDALEQQRAALKDPSLTPSARILDTLRERRLSFFELSLEVSKAHRDYFRALRLSDERMTGMLELSAASLEEAAALERRLEPPFEDYLAAYFAQA
jgi:glutamate--cysteine ligase